MPITIYNLGGTIISYEGSEGSIIYEGSPVVLNIHWSSISPAGIDPVVAINWGDTTSEVYSVAYTPGVYDLNYTHAFALSGTLNVKITVYDTINTVPLALVVAVVGVPPAIGDGSYPTNATLNNTTGAATLEFEFTDPGATPNYIVDVAWGDDSVDAVSVPYPTVILDNHTYDHSIPAGYLNPASHRFPIVITVTDSGGLFALAVAYAATLYDDVVLDLALGTGAAQGGVLYNDTVVGLASSSGAAALYRLFSTTASGICIESESVVAVLDYATVLVIPSVLPCQANPIPFEQLIPGP